jgi:hypothetical protein
MIRSNDDILPYKINYDQFGIIFVKKVIPNDEILINYKHNKYLYKRCKSLVIINNLSTSNAQCAQILLIIQLFAL